MEIEKRIALGCNIRFDKTGKDITTFRSGGKIKYYIEPKSEDALAEIICILKEKAAKYAVIGKGSNLLISDKGYDGYLISTDKLSRYAFFGTHVFAEAGCNLAFLSAQSVKNSLSGLEFAAGIPGTVGGGLYMNCGAFGGQLSDITVKANAIVDNERRVLSKEELDFSYRSSIAQKKDVIFLSVEFELQPSDISSGLKKREEYCRLRTKSQPRLPSAGSVFRRYGNLSAGKLIDDIGLKGYRVGGAQISELHGNFIVNTGNATTQDFLDLKELMKKEIKEKYGIELKEEVEYIE